jgi:hypothetical protein
MGLVLVKYAELQENTLVVPVNCVKDADCYKANTKVGATITSWPELTTDADKKKTCCMYTGYVSMPPEWTDEYKTIQSFGEYGGPKNILEYSKTCSRDFPTVIGAFNVLAAAAIIKYAGNPDSEDYEYKYDEKTGINKFGKQNGGFEMKSYCDGGAATLVAASTAAFAVTISLY